MKRKIGLWQAMRVEFGYHTNEKRRRRCGRLRAAIVLEAVLLLVVGAIFGADGRFLGSEAVEVTGDGYIKWVDFNVSYEALCKAYEYDVDTYGAENHLDWIWLLAYVAARNGGDFGAGAAADICDIAEKLKSGETTMEEASGDLKYFSYYKEAYGAVLGGFVGEYEVQETEGGAFVKKYGLKAFSPVAKGFPYSDYDDFGVSRSYGYRRQHLGHDMMGQVGTPIVSVESGIVEALGWNQYGGWRIGIRSFDGQRYYYYAHLRQNYPYREELKPGDIVTAGEVIGYMGHTGYSAKENVNNIDTVHLHFGLQLIFDESQKEGNNEIWVDCYNLTRFLYKNRSEVHKVEGTKEWRRNCELKDPAVTAQMEGDDRKDEESTKKE